MCKLTDRQAALAADLFKRGVPSRRVGALFGIGKTQVLRIAHGEQRVILG